VGTSQETNGRALRRNAARRRTALVTGAGGFIGGHLVGALLAEGFSVRAVDRKSPDRWYQAHEGAESLELDLSAADACARAVRGIDDVYNLAADMGGMGFIESSRAACMLSVLISTNMLVAARDEGVGTFFYSSSACVYPVQQQDTPDVAPLEESDAYPAMAEDGYGWEKLFSERMCRHFSEDFGLETRVARYHNVYGPHGTFEGGREKAPAAICRKVAEAALTGGDSLEIWGDGKQTRSFMYIDDCIEGTLRIARGPRLEPLNLGTSELVTINELVDAVEDVAGTKLRRDYNTDAPQGVRGRNSDNTLIKRHLGWEPTIPLREGIAPTYAWIHEQLRARAPVSA